MKRPGLVALTLAASLVAVAAPFFSPKGYSSKLCDGMMGVTRESLEKTIQIKKEHSDLQPFPDCGLEWYLRGFDDHEQEGAIGNLIKYSQARGYAKQKPGSLPVYEAVNFSIALSKGLDPEVIIPLTSLTTSKGSHLFPSPASIAAYVRDGGTLKDAQEWVEIIEKAGPAHVDFLGFRQAKVSAAFYSTLVSYKDDKGKQKFDDIFIIKAGAFNNDEQFFKEVLGLPGSDAFSHQGIYTRLYYQISEGYYGGRFDESKRDAIVVFGAYENNEGVIRNAASRLKLAMLAQQYNVYPIVAENEADLYHVLNMQTSKGRAEKTKLLLIESHGSYGMASLGVASSKFPEYDERLFIDLGDVELREHLESYPKDMVVILSSCFAGGSNGHYPSLVDAMYILSRSKTTLGPKGLTNSSHLNLDYANPANSTFMWGGNDTTYKRQLSILQLKP